MTTESAPRMSSKKRKDQPVGDDGSADGAQRSKEERREAKRLKKLAQASQIQDEPSVDTNGTEAGIVSAKVSSVSADEAQKQKKAARKAEKKSAKRQANGQTGTPSKAIKAGKRDGAQDKSEIDETQTGYRQDPSLVALPQATIDAFLMKHHITVKDPETASVPHRPIIEFEYLPKDAVAPNVPSPFAAFKSPTPIQAASWPHLLAGRDLIGVAETGSGKTIAFGLPCIRAILAMPDASHGSPARAVIVSPTRELASQIHVQLDALAKPLGLETTCLYGGVPKDMQIFDLKTAHIIVATPGRLKDLVDDHYADLSQVKYLVLDEADRMLDKGFEDAIRDIISRTPTPAQGRQTCMFTATWPQSVRELAATFMQKPVHIAIGADNPTGELRANKSILQVVEVMDGTYKEGRLRDLIAQHSDKQYSDAGKKSAKKNTTIDGMTRNRILVFCLYKKEAARIEDMLRRRMGSSISVAGIHGDMSQPLRTQSLDAFKSGSVSVLVATDVAARGLDIPDVKVVINVTFPLTVEDYVHRIGRTGRAGAQGLAITFFTEHDKGLAGGLVNVLKAAGQNVPDDLLKFGTTVKKKQHEVYGAFYREPKEGEKQQGTMMKFD